MAVLIMLLVLLVPATAHAKKSVTTCRDAGSGRMVTKDYAKANPTTTVCERRTSRDRS